jgi:hypothetical protein
MKKAVHPPMHGFCMIITGRCPVPTKTFFAKKPWIPKNFQSKKELQIAIPFCA